MEQTMQFGDVLEAVDKLSPDEQQALLEIVARRMAEESRKRLALEIQESRREFVEGRCKPTNTKQIMDDILS